MIVLSGAVYEPALFAQQSTEVAASSSNNWQTAQHIAAGTPDVATEFDAATGQVCGQLIPNASGLFLRTVAQGQQYAITASGCVSWNTDNTGFSDPDGTKYPSPGCVTASGTTVAPGGFYCPGLSAWSLVGKIANGTCIQLGKDVCFTASATGDFVVYFNDDFYDDNSGSWNVCLTPAVDITAFSESASCSGFDGSLDPQWLMVPTPGNNTAVLAFGSQGSITISSDKPGVATVSPTSVSTSPQTITVTGVSKGTATIKAGSCGKLNVTVKTKPLTYAVTIHAITEENDDVQVIEPGKGLANATCITPGPNGRLDTTPGGDDKKQGNNINTGANGICNTRAAGDDVQVIPFGQGQPNAVCVSPGKNKFRDTKPVDDDGVSADDKSVTTGANGICSTTANSVNVPPLFVPTAASLEAYLNNVYGKQANVFFSVSRSDKAVNYDLHRDEMLLEGQSGLLSPEQLAIINAIRDVNANNIYYVQDLSVNVGHAYPGLGLAFVQNERYGNSGERVTAHEIGHIGGLGHPEDGFRVEPNEYITTRLMTISYSHLNTCRLNKCEWDILNP